MSGKRRQLNLFPLTYLRKEWERDLKRWHIWWCNAVGIHSFQCHTKCNYVTFQGPECKQESLPPIFDNLHRRWPTDQVGFCTSPHKNGETKRNNIFQCQNRRNNIFQLIFWIPFLLDSIRLISLRFFFLQLHFYSFYLVNAS